VENRDCASHSKTEPSNYFFGLSNCGSWVSEREEPVYRQEKRGHPGPNTKYVRKVRKRFSVAARVKDEIIEADARTDGMFPLISNCRDLSLKQILEAYKFQPKLEKRHEQLKSVQDLAPVWLKNVSRIEALLFLYFVALLVHALLERELRQGMDREQVESLPLYPEERLCRAPSTERILDLFAPLQRHRLRKRGNVVQVFEPELGKLHKKVLLLMGLPVSSFRLKP
jgi:transposase